MNQYELLYIVPTRYTDDELNPIKQKVRQIIESENGKIFLEDNLGKKKLAYPIKKIFQGYYLLCHFDLEGSALKKINRDLQLSDEIIRYIVVKFEPKTAVKLEKIKEGMKSIYDIHEDREFAAPKPVYEEPKKEKEKEQEKVNLEDLDKKLDEIIKNDDLL